MEKKKSNKIIIILIIIGAVLAGIVTAILFMSGFASVTKKSFKSYSAFKEKSESTSFAAEMPQSSENVAYYFHSGTFKKKSCYRMKLSDSDYKQWKKEADERYLSYMTPAVTESFIHSEGVDAKAVDISQLEDNDARFVTDMFTENDGYCLYSYIKKDSSVYKYYFGIICNDTTNEVIEFYIKDSNSNAF